MLPALSLVTLGVSAALKAPALSSVSSGDSLDIHLSAMQQARDTFSKADFSLATWDEVSPDCKEAITDLSASFSQCSSLAEISTLLATSDLSQQAVSAVCEDQCVSAYQEVFEVLGAECTGDDIELAEDALGPGFDFEDLRFSLRLPCVQDPQDVYCLPTLTALTNGNRDWANVTAAELEDICTPCLKEVVAEYLAFSDDVDAREAIAFFDVLCAYDEPSDLWCFIEANEVNALDIEDGDRTDRICSSNCFSRVTMATELLKDLSTGEDRDGEDLAEYAEVVRYLDGMCASTPNGGRCLDIFRSLEDNFLNPESLADIGCEELQASFTCTDECKGNITAILNQADCCFNLYLDVADEFVTTTQNTDLQAKLAQARLAVTSLCGLSPADSCEAHTSSWNFNLRNLLWSYVQANPDLVRDLMTKDIAMRTGIPARRITVQFADGANDASGNNLLANSDSGSVQVFVTLEGDDSALTNNAQANYEAALNDGTALAFASQLPLASLADPSQQVVVSASSSSGSSTGVSSAVGQSVQLGATLFTVAAMAGALADN